MEANNEGNRSLELTARWTASARAQESTRDDCLFNDPWAAALAGQEGYAWLEQRGGSMP
jgi:O-methyltransferase involved in polyketide biosynthesis